MAKKWFSTTVVAYASVLVEAETAAEAEEVACTEPSFGDLKLDTTEDTREITDPQRLEMAKKKSGVLIYPAEEGGAK